MARFDEAHGDGITYSGEMFRGAHGCGVILALERLQKGEKGEKRGRWGGKGRGEGDGRGGRGQFSEPKKKVAKCE